MNYQQVKKKLLQVFESDPNNIEITGKLASAYMETRDFEGALKILKKAVEIKPTEYSLTNLGYFYLYEGESNGARWFYQSEKAIEVLGKAILLCPKSYMAYSVLGEAYLLKERNQDAEEVLKKGAGIKETTPNLNNLGVALYRQNKFEEAVDYFEKSHQKHEKNYSFYPFFNYGLCLSKCARKNDSLRVAEELLKNVREKIGEPDLVDIACIYYENSDYENVVEVLRDAFNLFAICPDIFGCYIYSLLYLNRGKEAQEFYEKTLHGINEQMEDVKKDDNHDWNEDDKKARIEMLEEEISDYKKLFPRVSTGEKPSVFKYLPKIEKDCYLFGCLRHHSE